jgi:hypothetical protein
MNQSDYVDAEAIAERIRQPVIFRRPVVTRPGSLHSLSTADRRTPSLDASRFLRNLDNCCALAELEGLRGSGCSKQVHSTGDQTRPPGLVTRAKARSVIAVEILVERNIVAPVRVLLKLGCSSINRAPPVLLYFVVYSCGEEIPQVCFLKARGLVDVLVVYVE